MPIRKTELKSTAGVKLIQVEEVGPTGTRVSTYYRLSTLRPSQPRMIADRQEAEDAFDLEVVASLMDPVVQKLLS